MSARLILVICLLSMAWLPGSLAQDKKPEIKAEDLDKVAFVKDGKLDIDAAVRHFEDLYRSDSSTSVSELTVTRPRRTRTLRMKSWTEGQEKALIIIESPKREKGTATLKVEKNLWNYLPRIKRTIRIPPSMMLGSWMGSDFTNDDLVRESSFRDDYTYKLAGKSEKPKGWILQFDAKPKIVGLWQKFELIVSEDGKTPLEAKYYDRKGRLARRIAWDQIKEFDGRKLPSRMTLTPVDKKGHKTIMTYISMKFDIKVAKDTFSLRRLEQQR